MRAHLFRFVLFERTGMRLLLCNSDLWKYIENCFALDFQFSIQIVDSNFTHPPSIFSGLSRSLFIATSARQFQLCAPAGVYFCCSSSEGVCSSPYFSDSAALAAGSSSDGNST